MQWLDELEDLIFAFALAWHRVCRFCLTFGLLASMLVMAPGAASFASLVVLTLVAAGSVVAWSVAVLTTLVLSNRLVTPVRA